MARTQIVQLAQKHCVSSGGESQVLPQNEAQIFHQQVQDWTLHHKSLQREFRFKNFKESMDFVRKVADIAEEEEHHPDISIFYNRVRLQLSTHTVGGITENDFIVAAKIDALLKS